jgi:hypothetical protein
MMDILFKTDDWVFSYPTQTPALLQKLDEGVQHFVYKE